MAANIGLGDRRVDELLGIATAADGAYHADLHHNPYEPTPYAVLDKVVASRLVRAGSTLVDYGCGLGRVALCLARETGCSSIGVDFDPDLVELARENARRAPFKVRATFVNSGAEQFDVPDEADVFFFFNPFSVETLAQVLGQIRSSLDRRPREARLMFYYPSVKYHRLLAQTKWLEAEQEIDCQDIFGTTDPREVVAVYSVR